MSFQMVNRTGFSEVASYTMAEAPALGSVSAGVSQAGAHQNLSYGDGLVNRGPSLRVSWKRQSRRAQSARVGGRPDHDVATPPPGYGEYEAVVAQRPYWE